MSNVTIRIDDALKAESQELLQKMGLTLNAGITMFLCQLCTDKAFPFVPHTDPFYSPVNQAHLLKSIQQIESGHVVSKTMEELEAMEHE
ncbi:MAG: type II toxin-antitoxin system RelB/DinJ family antitoxin [Clostridiales bacterium]|jgi:DNA-damage-inducible protein J|nr:type II toxin-antitoxin system RelB/DinJ family antitoxin [Clostridiales bacterium]